MHRISIRAVSSALPPAILEQVNQRHQTLVNTISIDFSDTGFFLKTGFDRVEILQQLSIADADGIEFISDQELRAFKALSKISIAEYEKANSYYLFEYAKLAAVKAISAIIEHFGLDARSFKTRAFHIEGEISRSRINESLPDDDFHYSKDLQIHIKTAHEDFATPEEFDFLAFEFTDTIDSLLQKNAQGQIEGNEVGGGYFTLFCVGENPKQMLETLKEYLVKSSKSSQDFVILVDEKGKDKISILSL